ncbi:MAG: hypothetical protein AAEJ04_01220 [Planctomycetota bacterium]
MDLTKKIAVIFGGDWGERQVSIESAKEVIGWLVEAQYDPVPVRWDSNGWVRCSTFDLEEQADQCDPLALLQDLRSEDVEIVFNCLHGGAGEDGTLAGLLAVVKMAHTGAGVTGSAVSACKITFRQRMRGIGLRVPTGAVVHQEVWDRRQIDVLEGVDREVFYPCFVKDPCGGSSEGVFLVENRIALIEKVDVVFKSSRLALIEQRVSGREISVPCLGGRKGVLPQVLQPVEVMYPEGEFFDTELKYGPHNTQCPAKIGAEQWHDLAREIRQLHLELQLGTVSRTDLLIDNENNTIYLETNSVPGMTKDSLLPLSAAQTGLDGPSLVRKMIEIAVYDHLERWSSAPSAI